MFECERYRECPHYPTAILSRCINCIHNYPHLRDYLKEGEKREKLVSK